MPTASWCFLAMLPTSLATSQGLPYRPWQDTEPLPPVTPEAPRGPAPGEPAPEYARRSVEVSVAGALRPVACWAGRAECSAHSAAGAARYRPTPHFAWSLNAETTRFAGVREVYLGIAARAYASRSGATDPFVELGLGGDFRGRPDDVLPASELAFGVSVALTERVKLSSALKFHQQGASCRPCRSWSPWAKRWVTLSLGLEVWLGEKH